MFQHIRNNFLCYPRTNYRNILKYKKLYFRFWEMGNGGYPKMDLNPEQNLKLKILKFCFFFNFCPGFKSLPGSTISHNWHDTKI